MPSQIYTYIVYARYSGLRFLPTTPSFGTYKTPAQQYSNPIPLHNAPRSTDQHNGPNAPDLPSYYPKTRLYYAFHIVASSTERGNAHCGIYSTSAWYSISSYPELSIEDSLISINSDVFSMPKIFAWNWDGKVLIFEPRPVFEYGKSIAEVFEHALWRHPTIKKRLHYTSFLNGYLAGAPAVIPFFVWNGVKGVLWIWGE